MRATTLVLVAALSLVAALLMASPAAAAASQSGLSGDKEPTRGAPPAASKVNSQKAMGLAEAAMQTGKLQDAVQWYQVVLSRPKDAKFHADAAYRLAMIYISDPAARDLARATEHLNSIRSTFPKSPRSPEALAALTWIRESSADTQAARAETTAARAETSAARNELESLRKQMAEAQTASTTTGARSASQVRVLRGEVDWLKADVARLEDELGKKNAALKRVASAVVGSKSQN